jgi:hypothetical protein
MSSATIIKQRKAAPVIILRSVPSGYDWGWYSREDSRMHVQTVDRKNERRYKVWLEKDGRRVFEPVGKIPAKVLKALEAEVKDMRRHVEARWVHLMIDNDWLKLNMSGRQVTVTAYPNVPGARFTRTFDIADYFPARYDPTSQIKNKTPIKPEDLVLSEEMAAIEVFPQKEESRRHHLFLPTILWKD